MNSIRRVVLMGISLVFCAMFFACGGGGSNSPSPRQSFTSPPAPASPAEPSIPSDLSYTIVEENTDEPFRKQGIKRSVVVRLSRPVSEEELRAVATKIKNSDPNTYERTLFGFHLSGDSAQDIYWASASFDPDLTVRIIGPSAEQTATLNQPVTVDPTREVVGTWLDERRYNERRMSIFRRDGKVFMETLYKDGSCGDDELAVESTPNGVRYMRVVNANGDFYQIDGQGGLQTWSGDRLNSTAKPVGAVAATPPLTENSATPSGGGIDHTKAGTRSWSDASGTHKTEAEFRGVTSGKVKLRKPDGSLITLPMEQLSEEDQAWIRDRARGKRR